MARKISDATNLNPAQDADQIPIARAGQGGRITVGSIRSDRAPLMHGHAIADVAGLQASLDSKAALTHTHAIADVANLQTELNNRSLVGHGHSAADISSGTLPVVRGGTGLTGVTANAFLRGNSAATGFEFRAPADVRTDIGAAAASHTHPIDTETTGSLPLSRLAQGGATNGQVLKWNGTAWAPGNDLTGGAGQDPIQFQDEGNNLGAAGDVVTVNFTGAGVTATYSAGTLTVNVPGGGGSTFTDLTDTPASYTSAAGYFVRVNAAASALEFRQPSDVRTDIGAAATSHTHVVADVSGVVPDTRTISTNNGLTGGGNLTANRTLGLTGQALALHNLATNGLIARTGASTVAARTITAGANISVTNGDGVSGNPTIAVTGLAAVATSGSASDLTTGSLALSRLAQGGASTGQVLTWNGTAWAPQSPSGSGQSAIQFQDEGNNLGSVGTVDTVNFTGAAVTATRSGNTVTVNVAGGGWRPKPWWEKHLEDAGLDLSSWIGSRSLRLVEHLTTNAPDANNHHPYLFNSNSAFSEISGPSMPNAVVQDTGYPSATALNPTTSAGRFICVGRNSALIHSGGLAFLVLRFYLNGLSDATDTYWTKLGFLDSGYFAPGANTNPEIAIAYTHTTNSGNWTVQYRTGSFGAPTVINTSVAAASNQPVTAVFVKESTTAGRVWISGMSAAETFTVSSWGSLRATIAQLFRTAGSNTRQLVMLSVALGFLDPS